MLSNRGITPLKNRRPLKELSDKEFGKRIPAAQGCRPLKKLSDKEFGKRIPAA